MPLILTNSELSAWQRCRRGWWLNYYRKLRRIDDYTSPTDIGSLYHEALAHYYTPGVKLGDPIDVIRNRATSLIEKWPQHAEEIAADAGMAGIMAEGYLEWLEETGADADLEVYAAEEAVEIELKPTAYILRGKMDARARMKFSGAHVQLEHKTVGNLLELPKTAQTAPQFLTYDLLAFLKAKEEQDLTIRTDGVLLNMAKKVKRTARATPPFYARHIVRHNTQELRSHWRHIIAIAGEIEEARRRLDGGQDFQHICPPFMDGRAHHYACPCAHVGALFDDGSDVEGFLAAEYVSHDPLERYAKEDI